MGYEYFYQNIAEWLLLSMLISIDSSLQILILDIFIFYFFINAAPNGKWFIAIDLPMCHLIKYVLGTSID